MLMAGSTEGVFGRHELELDEAYLTERTHVNEMRHALSALDRIEASEEHFFVYITSIQGHIIPKHRVVVGDADQFIQRLRELVSAARES